MGKALQKPAQGRALGEPFRFHSHPPSGSRDNLIDRYCSSIADGAEYGEVALHACLLGYEVHGPRGSGARNFIQYTGAWLVLPLLSLPHVIFTVIAVTYLHFSLLLIPLSIGIAILRSRLWDINLLINRALVYGTLTACVIGIYVLVVGTLGILLQARSNLFISLLATGLVAVLFQPLRQRLQHAVNRLMYGERDDPYRVIARLGQLVYGSLAAHAVLPTFVERRA